jgi:predicted ribosome quality control (RQC) complex YloA/Tae2 family protein
MDKESITSLDLRFLVREMRPLLRGGFFRKIYMYGRKEFLFEVFSPGSGGVWLYVDSGKMFLTEHKLAIPQEPPSFCMFMRKHLMGKRIKDIEQHDFDRIVEIKTEENILIFELLNPGNVILCDSSYNIIMPLEIQRWKDREIISKKPYKYPPKLTNPFGMDFDTFFRFLRRSEKKLEAILASSLGFGPLYAKEIVSRSDVENRVGEEIGMEAASKLHQTISVMDKELDPSVYKDFVSPFPLQSVSPPLKKSESFSKALDEFFIEHKTEEIKEEEEAVVDEEKARVERILETQDKSMEKWSGVEKDSRDIAEIIYNHYSTVEGVLTGIQKAKESGLSWEEIKEKVQGEETPEAEAIKEIRENEGIVVIELSGKEIELDYRKSVEENAASFYEDAKWAKGKQEGIEKAKEVHEEMLDDVKPPETIGDFVTKKPRKKWYEKFKWFLTSDGFLVIGGRDASSNETIIKKYLLPEDLVFHADIPGAAFVVIKVEGKEVSNEAKKEAAEFAAANSKAWSRGLGTIDIFCVRPDQVDKSPPSGEALGKGAFMIHGEREWFRDMELKLAIGFKIDREESSTRVMGGPVLAVRKNTDYFITIKPGFKKSLELARSIKNKILIKCNPDDKGFIESTPLEDIEKMIPSGMGEIVEYG